MSAAADALWQVVEVEKESIVELDGKVKFPRGTVVYSGARQGALQMVLRSKQRLAEIRAIAECGDGGSVATTTRLAHASTAGYSAHSSTAGYYAHSSTAGNSAHSSTAGNYAHSSTAGNYAHSSTAGDSAHSSTAGKNSISAALGLNSRVRAGEKGAIVAAWWDENGERVRVLTGHVGEDGIKPNTWYEVKVSRRTPKWKEVKG